MTDDINDLTGRDYWTALRASGFRWTPKQQRARETRELLRLCRQDRSDLQVALWLAGIIVERAPGSSLASGWRLFCELHEQLGPGYTAEAYAVALKRAQLFSEEVSAWPTDRIMQDKSDAT